MLRRRLLVLLLITGFAALFFLPSLVALLLDWWWFKEIGYQIVFTRELVTRVLLFLAVGGLTFGTLYLNLRMAQRGMVPEPIVLRLGQSIPRATGIDLTRSLRRMSLPLSLTLGFLAGLAAAQGWELALRFLYQTPFGVADPVFSRDIGFYVFSLPALGAILAYLTGLALITLVAITAV
jgi:uncharacterized protein